MTEIPAIVALLVLLLLGWHFTGQPVSNPSLSVDSSVYLSGAASLASGNGYRYSPIIGQPTIGFYPPGQSAWLALFWATAPHPFPASYGWLWLGQTVLALAMFVAFHQWCRSLGVPRLIAVLLAANIAWSPVTAWIHVHLFSDFGFALFLLSALLCWRRFGMEQARGRLAVGVCLALATLWRSPGIAILGACALATLATPGMRSIGKLFQLFGPGVVAVLGPKLYGGSGDSYVETLGRVYKHAAATRPVSAVYKDAAVLWISGLPVSEPVFSVLNRLPPIAARLHPSLAWVGIGAAAAGTWILAWLAVRGTAVLSGGQRRVLLLSVGCYLLLVLVLPQPPLIGTCSRYMFPVAAVFVPFAFLGAGRVFRPLSRFRAARPAAAVLLALLALQELRATREIVAACNATDTVVELREFARAIGTRLPTNAVIATDYNLPIVDLWTASGRRFAMDPSSCCMGPSDAAIGSPAISHRVVAGPPWPPGAPVLRSSSDHWRIYPATRNAVRE